MKPIRDKVSKLFLVIAIIMASFSYSTKLFGQSGFSEGEYYNYQYQISDVAVGYPYTKYNYYGVAVGIFQVWQRAVWHSGSGGHYVMIWNNYSWVNQWTSGSYYWYEWVNYERRVG